MAVFSFIFVRENGQGLRQREEKKRFLSFSLPLFFPPSKADSRLCVERRGRIKGRL